MIHISEILKSPRFQGLIRAPLVRNDIDEDEDDVPPPPLDDEEE